MSKANTADWDFFYSLILFLLFQSQMEKLSANMYARHKYVETTHLKSNTDLFLEVLQLPLNLTLSIQ